MPQEAIRDAAALFHRDPLLRLISDSVPNILLVLNESRQIVFANKRLLKILGCQNVEDVCGLRPGQVFSCVHADEAPMGCGTTEFCRTCGAVKAILGSLSGQEMVEECRILQTDGGALEVRVWTTPLTIKGKRYSLFAVADITHEKRRFTLERVFFHDLLNLAGAIQGFSEFLAEASDEELPEIRRMICSLAGRLVEEIRAHKTIYAAEHGELQVHPVSVETVPLLEELAESYRLHPAARNRDIVVDPASENVTVVTDRSLLMRVLENMLKNALEAIQPGQKVTMRSRLSGENIVFEVHNPGTIPHDVQLQIFLRSYTTKGQGRGLGTYSMKLLGERYLKGKVSFESSPESGTVFRFSLPLVLQGDTDTSESEEIIGATHTDGSSWAS